MYFGLLAQAGALIIGFALASAASGQEAKRSMTPIKGEPNSKSELSYRKKWAVIIGINYSPVDREAAERRQHRAARQGRGRRHCGR